MSQKAIFFNLENEGDGNIHIATNKSGLDILENLADGSIHVIKNANVTLEFAKNEKRVANMIIEEQIQYQNDNAIHHSNISNQIEGLLKNLPQGIKVTKCRATEPKVVKPRHI